MKKILFLALLLSFSMAIFAQDRTVSGTVNDADNATLPGASVVVKGTSVGTITDFDGKYSLNVPSGSNVLVVSFMGFTTLEVDVTGKTSANVVLNPDSKMLADVVVTALGIEKREKGLTYSTQQMEGDELVRAKDANMINSLAGKSAGVTITRSASGVGGSSKVNIRGNRSASGSNQPLYVIDGIPMLNSTGDQPATTFGGTNDAASRDGGDGISNLNPDDIKSMTVLKGPAAAALYGTQAANGVVVITTKKGLKGESKASFSSNLTFENAVSLPELQTKYGEDLSAPGMSWGAATNASSYDPKDFFQRGYTAINSVSFSKGGDKMQTYFSYANTKTEGIVGGTDLNRHNFNVRGTSVLYDDKLSLDANITLVNQTVNNRPVPGGYYFNPIVGLYRSPRGRDMSMYQDKFEVYNVDRNMNVQNWYKALSPEEQNPWWLTNRVSSNDVRNRAIASLTAKWTFSEHFNVQSRASVDFISDQFNQKVYATTEASLVSEGQNNGRYIVLDDRQRLGYADLLANYNNKWGDWALTASVGASINDITRQYFRMDSRSKGLYKANIFNLANMNVSYLEEINSHKQSQSLFGTAQLGYKDYLFLDVTGRNDWSSALAFTESAKSGFFYPSVGLTAVISDMLTMPEWVNLGKVRAAWSSVGNDIPLYVSQPLSSLAAGGNVIFNGNKPFDNLKPEISKSIEIGTEWQFFNRRLGIDLTYYRTNTTNQFFQLPAAAGSGYSYYYINAGNLQNQGVEAIVNVTPVEIENFYWKSTFNFSLNRNEVIELHPDLKEFTFSGQTSNSYWMKMVVGGAYGDIYGKTFKRDASGKITLDADGLPVIESQFAKIANSNPKFALGWNNSLTYGAFNFGFLVDARIGGDVVSMTQADLDLFGSSATSGEARDAGGVDLEGQKITKVRDFYTRVGGRAGVSEYYVYSATNIRLRELTISYDLPKSLLVKTGFIQGASVSAVARNLFFLYNEVPFDPDATLSTGNDLQGVDVFGMPSTRSFGFNIKLNF